MEKTLTKEDILEIVKQDKEMMQALKAAKQLNLPDTMIGAGFIRNKIWDYLHNYKNKTRLDDIDVIYYNKENIAESVEKEYEKQLQEIMPGPDWSVKNQARMHLKNNEEQYLSSEDALSRWVETPTCTGLKLDENNNLILIAPHGISDLVNLKVTPSPNFNRNINLYLSRIKDKKWQEKWPKLKIQTEF